MMRIHILFLLLTVTAWQLSAQDAYELLIRQVRLFDGDRVQGPVDVAVRDGKIVELGQLTASADTVIDGRGLTMLPGMINAHVHAWFPGHLQMAAKAGVFTLCDMHSTDFARNWLSSLQDSLGYATYWSAGPGATVPQGHGTQFGMVVPTIDSTRSAKEFVEERIAQGVNYIKILREPSRPTVSFAQCDTIIRTAHAAGVKVVAHVSRAADAVRLAELGIDGLVHVWFDQPVTDEQLDTLARSGCFIVPTTLTNIKVLDYFDQQDDPPTHMSRDVIIREVGRLHEAGITLVAGTDPPNFNINYGDDLYRELELLVEAGLSPVEALRAATSHAAEAFGMENTGYLRPGTTANFLLVKGDVTSDIKALFDLAGVWHLGQPLELAEDEK